MQKIIILALIGSAVGALVPLSPGLYTSLISHGQLQTELPLEYLDDRTSLQQYLVHTLQQEDVAHQRLIPTAVFENGRPTIAHIPMTYNYYGTPIYDFRFPVNPISPPAGSIPSAPGYIPGNGIPQTPSKPSDDDGIEKLDDKVEPADHDPVDETADAANRDEVDESDSVAVESV